MTEMSALHEEPAEKVAAALGDLEQREIIRVSNGSVEIRSRGAGDALLASRSAATLKRRHKNIAEKLAGIRGRTPSNLEIAKHFLAAGIKRSGLRYGLSGIEAGEVEKDRAFAVPILEELRRVPKSAARSERARVLFALVEALSFSGHNEHTAEVIEEYFAAAGKKEPVRRKAKMHRFAAECYGKLNRVEEADAAWRRALKLAESDTSGYLTTLSVYTSSLARRGMHAESEKLLLEALEQYGDRKSYEIVSLYISLSKIRLGRNQREAAASDIERAMSLAREIGVADRPNLLNLVAVSHAMRDELDKAVEYLARAKQLAAEKGEHRVFTIICNNMISAYLSQNKIDEALQTAAEVETILRHYADFMGLAHHYSNIGHGVRHMLGCDTARSYLEKGLEYARVAGSPPRERIILFSLASVSNARGDFEGAIRRGRESGEIAEQHQLEPAWLPEAIMAMALLHAGDLAGGIEAAERGLEIALEADDTESILGARHVMGRAALLSGNLGAVLQQLDGLAAALPEVSPDVRFDVLSLSADFCFTAGQLGRVEEILRRIAEEPEMTKKNLHRGTNAVVAGRLAIMQDRFSEAETFFRTANHLHNTDLEVGEFIKLRHAEVELELHRREAEAAKKRFRHLQEAVEALPGKSPYFQLLARELGARIALLEGDREAAYGEAMSGMREAESVGYRVLNLGFIKTAAEAARDREEAEKLRKSIESLAADMAKPFDDAIRESVQTHLVAPPNKSI